MNTIEGPLFRFTEMPGAHGTGLKVVEQYDVSRTFRGALDALGKPFAGERARPLQTLVWYPSERGGRAMTVGDYANLFLTETTFGEPRASVQAREWIAAMRPTLGDSMWAVRDAVPVGGRFPVVIYAPSFSSPSWENADLCEYLASHGYVVIASPCMGATARGMTTDLRGIDAQARDISFLAGYARTLPNADAARVAVAGFSWGGISNLFAAAHDSRIEALVALDGSLRYWPGLVRKGEVHPKRMRIPLLYFAQGEVTLEDVARYYSATEGSEPNVLNAWTHGDVVIARMLGLTHRQHSSMFQRNEDFWKDAADPGLPTAMKADYTRAEGIAGYGWIARYTLRFLDAYLKEEASARTFLAARPAENGVPPHFMDVTWRRAEGPPASLEALRAEIGRLGFARAADILDAMQKTDPDFQPDESAMNSWSEELLAADHVPEAVTLLAINARFHPDSAMAHLNLGKGRAFAGDERQAVDCYRKALEIDPRNPDARRRLRALEGEASRS